MGIWRHPLSAAGLAFLASACTPTFETCNDDSDCQNGTTCTSGGCFAVARDGGVDSDPDAGSDVDAGLDVDAGADVDAGSDVDSGPDVPVECLNGTVDNGAGVCVSDGDCAPGFAALYRDGDEDGVGVDFIACSDADVDPPAGTARVAGDCDDDNRDAFRAASFFFDHDADGVTGPAAADCVGATDPPGAGPPSTAPLVLLVDPIDANSINVDTGTDEGDWDDPEDAFQDDGREAQVDLDDDSISEWLRVTSFACLATGIPFAVVDTFEVAVRVRVDRAVPVRVTARLVRGGVASDEIERVFDLNAQRRDVTVSGPVTFPDDFQCSRFGAGRVSLDVRFSPVVESPGDVRVDSVRGSLKDIDGDSFDCDDDDDDGAALVSCFVDVDGDHAGRSGSAETRCTNAALVGYAVAGGDCDDDDARAFPGQGAFFLDPRNDGSYDFNCDGMSTPRALGSAVGCTTDAVTGVCSALGGTVTGPCGNSVEVGICDATCLLDSTFVDQTCR